MVGQAQYKVTTGADLKKIVKDFIQTDSSIKIENIKYTGGDYSIGLFKGYCKEFAFNEGIIISTGNVMDTEGPNNCGYSGTYMHLTGYAPLEPLAKGKTIDAFILEFDFSANTDSISFDYLFATEEFPEFVDKGLNDVFAFFVSEKGSRNNVNIATMPGSNEPVCVNNVKFVYNSRRNINPCLFEVFQMDGISRLLQTGLKIKPYQRYHFVICIADVGDGYYDSSVLLRSKSFTSNGIHDFTPFQDSVKLQFQHSFIKELSKDKITFSPDIKFNFNDSTLTTDSYLFMLKIARLMTRFFDVKVEVTGHADDIGTREYNHSLSLARARSVAKYLMDSGISAKRITVKGLGSSSPLIKTKNDHARTANRRVEFKFYY